MQNNIFINSSEAGGFSHVATISKVVIVGFFFSLMKKVKKKPTKQQ